MIAEVSVPVVCGVSRGDESNGWQARQVLLVVNRVVADDHEAVRGRVELVVRYLRVLLVIEEGLQTVLRKVKGLANIGPLVGLPLSPQGFVHPDDAFVDLQAVRVVRRRRGRSRRADQRGPGQQQRGGHIANMRAHAVDRVCQETRQRSRQTA